MKNNIYFLVLSILSFSCSDSLWTDDAPSSPIPTSCCLENSSTQKDISFASPLIPIDQRKSIGLEYQFTNQNGKHISLADGQGKPIVVSFMYTRCENPNVCQRVTLEMDKLNQLILKHAEVFDVSILLVSYDSKFDTPQVLNTYAKELKISPSGNFHLLQPRQSQELFNEFDVAASINPKDNHPVKVHAIQMAILDKHGRIAQTFDSILWDNSEVIETLEKLTKED